MESNEREEALAQENKELRQRLVELTETKKVPEAEVDPWQSKEDDLLDQVDLLKKEINHLQTALEGKHMNLQPGDVVFVDNQKLINSDHHVWMKIAKKFGCTFVSVPLNGMDSLSKASNLELEKWGLRKIEEVEKSTALEKLDSIMIDLKSALELSRSTNDMEGAQLFSNATKSLFNAMEDIKRIYAHQQNKVEQ